MLYEYTCPECGLTDDLGAFHYQNEVQGEKGFIVGCEGCEETMNVLALEQGELLEETTTYDESDDTPTSDIADRLTGP